MRTVKMTGPKTFFAYLVALSKVLAYSHRANINPSLAPSVCAAEGSDGVLVAHNDCDKFYKCSGGRPVPLSCPPDLLYNPDKEYCDWPENVHCNKKPGNAAFKSADYEYEEHDYLDNFSDHDLKLCSENDSDGVLIPHEKYCNQFYKCFNGKPVVVYCPVDFLYNPKTQICDWPENVECGKKIIQNKNSEEKEAFRHLVNIKMKEAFKICAVPGSDGKLIAHEVCNKYYKCFEGKPVALDCPLNLVYNPKKEYCDLPEKVDCEDKGFDFAKISKDNGGTSIQIELSEAEKICMTENSNDILIAHKECNKFYKCLNGKPVMLTCPLTLLYNPRNGYCDWPENVPCESIPATTKRLAEKKVRSDFMYANPRNAPSICALEDSEGKLIAHEVCNKFYKCSGGKSVEINCPGSLYFNPQTEYCDWPENVHCFIKPTDENSVKTRNKYHDDDTVYRDPDEAPVICASQGSNGKLISHRECNKFYRCLEGQPVVVNCPFNLLFNVEKKYCDWPENVQCEKSPIEKQKQRKQGVHTYSVNDDPNKAPQICAAEGSDGILVAHKKCSKFYKCFKGTPVEIDCPDNLLYNPVKEYCDWPENVHCVRPMVNVLTKQLNRLKNKLTRNSDPRDAVDICADKDSDGILIAHEECDKFYRCTDSHPVELSCPPNLFYNPLKKYCDWPENVSCRNLEVIRAHK